VARALGRTDDGLLLKLDSQNGFGLGGNKVRKLEFVLSPPRLQGITTLVTCGGVQSNHARITAAAAAYLGLECVLVLDGDPPEHPTGNALLHRLLGASIRPVSSREERDGEMAAVSREVAALGGQAMLIPLGASTPVGALGYVRAAREFVGQLVETETGERRPTTIFMASSSCGTLAGLALGLRLMDRPDIRVVPVSADVSEERIRDETLRIGLGTAEMLGETALDAIGPDGTGILESVVPQDGYVGEGYAIPTPAGQEATELFARKAGVILDPVYTAKAASALVDWIRSGRVSNDERVIFWHTGGHPAILAQDLH
jgi:1-aminocyclopropane-1-carboxylate deaminase/D-cysteine desulfhydrase-like pyridoxal-dependent ACC family enzyme